MRGLVASLIALALAALGACGEKLQTASTTKKADGKPWEGTQSAYMVPGWKAGDARSWEEQMKARAQGQNEYSRTTNK